MKCSEQYLWLTTTPSKSSLYLQNWLCASYGAFWDGSIQLCPFYWHITMLTFSWSKQHYVPHGLHLLVAFEGSVDDRSSVWFLLHPHLWKGTSVQGHITPYCTTSKVAWQQKPMVLLHQWCVNDVFTFLYRTALLSFLGLAVGWWNLYLYAERGKRPHLLQRGSIW